MAEITGGGILLGLALGAALVLAWSIVKAGTKAERWKRARVRDALAIPSAAKVLAAEPGSRLNTKDWTDVLFDLSRAGFSLDESLGLVKKFRMFWKRPE